MLDLRLPSGLFFVVTGAILVIYGLAFPSARAPLTNANVDLYTGLVMMVFGAALLLLARRSRRA